MKDQLTIIDDQALQERLICNVQVLEQVKEIITIKNTEYLLMQHVAHYFGAETEAVQSIVRRHKDELISDGYQALSSSKLKEFLNGQVDHSEKIDLEGLKINNKSNHLFNKRCLLRIGMLLTDNEVAVQIRTALLDFIEDHEEEFVEEAVEQITTKQLLMLKVIEARTETDRLVALSQLNAHTNDLIDDLTVRAEEAEEVTNNLLKSDAVFNLTETAKNIGVQRKGMITWLEEKKILFRTGSSNKLMPHAQYTQEPKRYFKVITTEFTKPVDNVPTTVTTSQMVVTMEGVEYIRKKYAQNK